jgi:ribose transport system permease protein
MTAQTTITPEPAGAGQAPSRPRQGSRVWRGLRPDKLSGLYVLILLCVIFGFWVPQTFLTWSNVQEIASSAAITAMIALVLLVPLAAGVFDLSIAANVGLATVVTLKLVSDGDSIVEAVIVAVAVSTVVGVFNGFVVNNLHVDSFIATLGSSSLLAALSYWVCNGGQVSLPANSSLNSLGLGSWAGIPKPAIYALVLAAGLWYFLEYTPTGRSVYATGGNMQAARLAGVRVRRIVFGALVVSGLLAGLIGVILASVLGSGNPSVGPSYLLPAFSAAFLGATQILAPRFNVPGTLVAIILLSTGVEGLQLAGAPVWVTDLFDGAALIVAVALAARAARNNR